jgi:hypothetical protein
MNTTTKTRKISALADRIAAGKTGPLDPATVTTTSPAARLCKSAAKALAKDGPQLDRIADLPRADSVRGDKNGLLEKKPPAPSVKTRPAKRNNEATEACAEKSAKRSIAEVGGITTAHTQMTDDGAPEFLMRKNGEAFKLPPLAGKAKLPTSAPARELAVPTAKPAKAAAAAKISAAKPVKPAKPAGKTKSQVVQQMLERGTTQAEMSKTCGWPTINLKVASYRAAKLGLPSTLVEKDGKLWFVATKAK